MTFQRILLVLLILLSIGTSAMAGAYRQDGVRNCIAYQKGVDKLYELLCKQYKQLNCVGSTTPRDDATLGRECACTDKIYKARLSSDDYNLYQDIVTHSFSKKEEAYYKKNILPVVDQADKTCGITN